MNTKQYKRPVKCRDTVLKFNATIAEIYSQHTLTYLQESLKQPKQLQLLHLMILVQLLAWWYVYSFKEQ